MFQWASLCNAFLAEAKWFASGQLPNAEEYLKTAVVSSGVHVVLVHMFFLLGHGITRESVNLVNDNPGIITSTATILRLWDDLGSAKVNKSSFFGLILILPQLVNSYYILLYKLCSMECDTYSRVGFIWFPLLCCISCILLEFDARL